MSDEIAKQITANSLPAEVAFKIRTTIELKKQIKQYEKEIKDDLLDAMMKYNIPSIKHEDYIITLDKRTSYTGNLDEIEDVYKKQSLDSAKITAHATLYGSLPANIEEKSTHFITLRASKKKG